MKLHIGIDDTDSPKKGCTTYIAAILVEKLDKLGCRFIDYPNLIRLNPNIPWKTRGNGAVCIRIECEDSKIDLIKEVTRAIVEKYSDIQHGRTDPAIVFLKGEAPYELSCFSNKAIKDIVSFKEAMKIVKKFDIEFELIKGRRGLIGAVAAIGEKLEKDHTFELIAYRTPENIGTKRKIDFESVVKMDANTSPFTFNNYDPETGRVLITPHGHDPILYGIRGESPEILLEANKLVKVYEKIERWVIFRTNQGTDAHLSKVESISMIKPFRPVIVNGVVSSYPKTLKGGHVIFAINDGTGEINCAAYEPTGNFREIIKRLIVEDLIEAYGGVRKASKKYPRTINLEKINIIKLADNYVIKNPNCSKCGKRMESAGKNQGFRCKKCKLYLKNAEKVKLKVDRKIKEGLYLPPPRAHRHLTKPLIRYGKEKSSFTYKLIENWHYP
ncbi:MAG: tRNA(Ile)(2)-agmatinylcytidine synthase [Candidatus Bathyarchaeia archaeon]